jgi:hypothetical protein
MTDQISRALGQVAEQSCISLEPAVSFRHIRRGTWLAPGAHYRLCLLLHRGANTLTLSCSKILPLDRLHECHNVPVELFRCFDKRHVSAAIVTGP